MKVAAPLIRGQVAPVGCVASRRVLPRERFRPLDPKATSLLRHPGHAHTLIDALAFGEESRVVARCINSVAADGEARIECQRCLRGDPRLIQLTEQRQGCGEKEMS